MKNEGILVNGRNGGIVKLSVRFLESIIDEGLG